MEIKEIMKELQSLSEELQEDIMRNLEDESDEMTIKVIFRSRIDDMILEVKDEMEFLWEQKKK